MPSGASAKLLEVARAVRQSGLVKEHVLRSERKPQTFVGDEFVTFALDNDLCASRKAGVALGQSLIDSNLVFNLSQDKHFRDSQTLYRFSETQRSDSMASAVSEPLHVGVQRTTYKPSPFSSSASKPIGQKHSKRSNSAHGKSETGSSTIHGPIGSGRGNPLTPAEWMRQSTGSADTVPNTASPSLFGSTVTPNLKFSPSVRVTLEGTEVRGDSHGRYSVFRISVHNSMRKWTVARRYREFRTLHTSLLAELPNTQLPPVPPKKIFGSMDPSFVAERAEQLIAYLQSLVATPAAWQSNTLISFLDDSANSLGVQVTLERLQRRVKTLERVCKDQQHHLRRYDNHFRKQSEEVKRMSRRLAALESHAGQSYVATADSVVSALSAVSPPESFMSSRSKHSVQTAPPTINGHSTSQHSAAGSSYSVGSSRMSPASAAFVSSTASPIAPSTRDTSSAVGVAAPPDVAPATPTTVSEQGSSTPRPELSPAIPIGRSSRPDGQGASGPDGGLPAGSFALPTPSSAILKGVMSPASWTMHPADTNPWSDSSTAGLALPGTAGVGAQAFGTSAIHIPTNAIPTALDQRVEMLLGLMQPSKKSLETRHKVCTFVAALLKRALGAQTFAVGCYPLGVFLPHDELQLSAFLCHGQERTWFVKVSEALIASSSHGNGATGDDSAGAAVGHDGSPCTVSEVHFVQGTTHRVKCSVDGVTVDISANQLSDLCLVAVLEQMDRAVGQDHLFKRSMLLVKSWCTHESRTYAGWNAMSALSWRALATILVWIFIRRNGSMRQPLQVLAWFLVDCSQFPWDSSILTIHGPVPIAKAGQLQKCVAELGRPDTVIDDLGGLPFGCDKPVPAGACNRLLPLQMLAGLRTKCCRRHGGDASTPSVTSATPDGEFAEVPPAAFEVTRFNVSDMLVPTRNLGSDIGSRQAARVKQLFTMGAKNLAPTLAHAHTLSQEAADAEACESAPGVVTREAEDRKSPGEVPSARATSGSHSWSAHLDTFFLSSWKAFGPEFRSSGHVEAESYRDCSLAPLEHVVDSVNYCLFLLDAEVTAPALLSLASQILADKGRLPVGEIGKLLQDATANPSLSATLKEEFGGLKKFLERYPGIFLISNDHPFNPHVFLRSSLTEEEVAAVMSGSASTPSSSRKKKASRRKKASGSTSGPNRTGRGHSRADRRSGSGGRG